MVLDQVNQLAVLADAQRLRPQEIGERRLMVLQSVFAVSFEAPCGAAGLVRLRHAPEGVARVLIAVELVVDRPEVPEALRVCRIPPARPWSTGRRPRRADWPSGPPRRASPARRTRAAWAAPASRQASSRRRRSFGWPAGAGCWSPARAGRACTGQCQQGGTATTTDRTTPSTVHGRFGGLGRRAARRAHRRAVRLRRRRPSRRAASPGPRPSASPRWRAADRRLPSA